MRKFLFLFLFYSLGGISQDIVSVDSGDKIEASKINLIIEKLNKAYSKIVYEAVFNYESFQNGAFILERNDGNGYVELGKPDSPGNRYHGISIMSFDTNNDSTMSNVVIKFTDEPSVSSGTILTYRLRVYGNPDGKLFSLNRTVSDLSSEYYYERASSYVELEERF